MKKKMFIAALACFIGSAVQAQSLSDLISTVKDKVSSAVSGSSSSVVGTWTYDSPEIKFESDNLLASLGGSAASSTVEEKLETVYDKIGMEGSTYTFEEDGSFSATVGKNSTSGTYTYDSDEGTLTLTIKSKASVTADVTVSSSSLTLLFEADKLMSALQTISSMTSSLSSTASTLNTLLSNYDGMQVGFKLTK